MTYVTFASPYGWQVLHVDGARATTVAGAVDEGHATRIAELLDRHGLVDVPLDQMEGT
jgi:hypothetical protein